MSVNLIGGRIGRKILYLLMGLFYVVSLSSLSSGENIDVGRLLGIRDKGELNKLAGEAEKVFQKNPKDKNSLITLGIAYHNLAILEVKKASEKAEEYLNQMTKLYPEDALSLALLGSAISMVGRDSYNIVKKMGNVNKGAELLDKAVTMAPDNVLVRMVRANNSLDIPKTFGRQKIGKGDLLHIEGIINKSPKEVTIDVQTEVYYQLGNIFKSEKDVSTAKSYFKKAAEVFPDSEWGKKAKKEL
jgi:tetratricopeptide (TPR) repeat protein